MPDDIQDSDGQEDSVEQKPQKRRTNWLLNQATDPDQNHPANDGVEPRDFSVWMSEEEFLDYVDQNCHLPAEFLDEQERAKEQYEATNESEKSVKPFDAGQWSLGPPSKDSKGFLRVRALHTKLKSGRYPVNTPPIRCRFVTSKDNIWISRISLEQFIEQNGADLGISKQYQDLYSHDPHSKPVAEKKGKRERADENGGTKKKRRVQHEEVDS